MLDTPPASIAAQSRSTPARSNWFHNLSIGKKQLVALLVCELIPIIGLGIGSTIVLTNSLRTQLLSQAKSEVAVTETNYNIKINQMGFGSRGQSDNPTIITAAKNHQRNENLAADLQSQLQQILQNEVKARRMEYATLVGKDLRIIANANKPRSKETVNNSDLLPLIQQVLKDGRQVKASSVISWEELSKESPPLPDGFAKQDALIRYVVTPVRDRDNSEIIGVLVFGDIVNRKLPIVENTLNAFSGGYSAVYFRRNANDFGLATALKKESNQQTQIDPALPDSELLKSAIDAKGESVTKRIDLNGQMYTVAAKAIPNRIVETPEGAVPVIDENASAVIVRGTPEHSLNELLLKSIQQEAIVFALAIAAIILWTTIFRRIVLKPIQELQQTTEAFANGDRKVRAQIFAKDEVGQLAIAFNHMADSINASEVSLANEVARQEQQTREVRALSEITVRMRRSLDPNQILQTATDEARNFLKLDRIVVYQFIPSTVNGKVIAESLENQNFSVIRKEIEAPLGFDRFEQYSTQSAWVIKDAEKEMNDRYRQQLAAFQTKAEIAVPLRQDDRIIGLICAQSCEHEREWQSSEITFFTQLVTQIGYALDQSKLLQERQSALQDAEVRKSSIQQQIIQLLSEIQHVSGGDLTVRANVSADDLGTVADFFNAVVESLRDLVLKVKHTSTQVSDLLSQNEDEVQHLAQQARQQAQETTRTLDSVEQMTLSMQSVAERAQQAAIVAQNATNAAKSGESVMDSTVTSIYSLRATVEDATRKVKQLGESSQQIGRVVSLINDLATQTDLLAINASIEATRAGEHGRGFGIVANEIGELASRSATATREIAALIETTQQQITEVVEAMNRGATQVVEGAHLARNAKQSLIHVVQVSEQMDSLVNSISEAMVSQANTSQSVTELIKEVAQVSSLTSDSSVRMSKALRQTVDVAEELQSSVGMFKVQMGDRE
ncbi:methyl-accepting chemotaxis protein [Leptolyngbya sp. NIES-2104]|uniref:methyl-accepting chemotaxis protein n=1 Tax=Leptolyngbya sp. NIES-2104 TaxID=1552121 RepID=UPI0006EC4CC4|nr:methyl-accepting chemotaxis protein [Leptolyngbya sp. NIES-2104]GAP98855.1 methyl-accepting chemotaxis protein [Leptolyngbya sp. NIES-2104]